jgi:hypothetical protein
MLSLRTADSPAALRTFKYTVFWALPDESVNDGLAEYGCHAAPLKLADSLAMYCVGLPVQTLFSVTVRLVVDAAPLLIPNDVIVGAASLSVIVSLRAADSPVAPLTFR